MKEKIHQDNLILKFVSLVPTKRRRPTNGRYNEQTTRAKYFIPNHNSENIPVCLKTFLGVLNISRFRINRISNKFRETGTLIKELRGGDRVSQKYKQKKESVMNFINSLRCSEPHYCAGSTNQRYLPAELTIVKLWKMYNSSVEGNNNLKVKQWYFRNIFNTSYNLGFGSPRVDVCSICLQFDERLKRTSTEIEKNTLLTEKRIHKLRAKAFYSLLKENDTIICTLSFDCQKNLPFPKLPDQATYYSRQLYLYNLTVVVGNSKSKMNSNNLTSYIWLENQFPKGSNEISSCLFHSLKNLNLSEPIEQI